ncbi:Rieske 2Fe-2S domain-containing protein [Streptomyces phaeochromogenes]|uniref:Rieske 2Fe-2S domain-containing protein n=1 Tax=Streptomyces phaeochromogenes TaxID=1923 RepID=UPI00369CD3B1
MRQLNRGHPRHPEPQRRGRFLHRRLTRPIGGHRCAVHRDVAGQLHAVDARCTHLGCLVAFNQADGAWECLCYGFRFSSYGEILEGPVTRPLERGDIRKNT